MRDAGTHILYCLSVSWHHTYLRRLRGDAGLHTYVVLYTTYLRSFADTLSMDVLSNGRHAIGG